MTHQLLLDSRLLRETLPVINCISALFAMTDQLSLDSKCSGTRIKLLTTDIVLCQPWQVRCMHANAWARENILKTSPNTADEASPCNRHRRTGHEHPLICLAFALAMLYTTLACMGPSERWRALQKKSKNGLWPIGKMLTHPDQVQLPTIGRSVETDGGAAAQSCSHLL